MAGVTETRTWDAYLTTTMDNYRKTLYDNIFNDVPLISYANGKLGIAVRGKTIKRYESSGNRITEQLMYGKNSTVSSYSGAETLPAVLQDGITEAVYSWKQYAGDISITNLQKATNSGEAQIINLLQALIKQTELTFKEKLNLGAWGDGTGNSSKDLTGLQALISATTTVGGISPTTHTWWKSDVTSNVGSFIANGRDAMRTAFFNVSKGADKIDVIFTTQSIWEAFEKTLEPEVRRSHDGVANSGFENITYRSIPVIIDDDCPSGEMFGLNSNYINYVVHPDFDMSHTPFANLVVTGQQDVTSAKILFYGNLTINNRRKFFRLTGITT